MLMFGLRLGEDPRAMVTTTPRGTPMKLTPKQARFVQEYLIDLNAAQAAIRAGYSAKTARVIGHENLRKPEIAAAVEKAMAERAERTEVTADLVVGELRKIAFANMADYMKSTPEGDPYLDFSALTPAQTAAKISRLFGEANAELVGQEVRVRAPAESLSIFSLD